MIKPQEINQDGLPVFNWKDSDVTEDGLPILKKKESTQSLPLSSLASKIGAIHGSSNPQSKNELLNLDPEEKTPQYVNTVLGISPKPTPQPKEQEIQIDETDPLKSVNQHLLNNTVIFGNTQSESTNQKSLLAPKDNLKYSNSNELSKILPSQASKIYNQVRESIFPTTNDAKNFLIKNKDKITPDNETAKLANEKIKRRDEIDNLFNETKSIPEMAAKYFGEKDIQGMGDAKLGRYVSQFLNIPEVIEKASEQKDFHDVYYDTKGNFSSRYPAAAQTNLATKISQKLEDERMTGWLYSNPNAETVDKAIEMLEKEGNLTAEEKNIYNKTIRPIIGVGGADNLLKTSDITHSLGRGLYKGLGNIDASSRDLINKVSGGVFQNLGLLETNEDRRKRLEQEQYTETQLQPKGIRKTLSEASEFAGFTVPMILGSAAGAPEAATMVMMFEGQNADKARELFKDNSLKQDLYTVLTTGIDAYLGKLLPTKKAAEGIKSVFEKDAVDIVNKLSNKEITEATAKKQFTDKLINFAKQTAKGNFATVNVLSAFQIAHNTTDAAFGKRDFNLESELRDVVSNYKDNFFAGTFLSATGALKGRDNIENTGRILREGVNNPSVLERLQNDPERKKNYETVLQVEKTLQEYPHLPERQKNRFMGEVMRENVLKEKEKQSPSQALKEPVKKEIAESQISQKKILDPEMSNTKFIQEMYDNDLLGKGSKDMLEVDGKFSESKVGSYLKYIAQQANNLDENWQPHKGEAPSLSEIPEQIIEVGNERWKKEIEAAKPKESKVSVILPEENKQGIPKVENLIGSDFEFNGKTYVVKNIESNGVHAKIKGDDKSPLKLILPIEKYNEITGKNIEAPKPIIITPEEQADKELVKRVESIKYQGGENARQYIDRHIADGYNKIITIKQGAVNKYYLDNERNGLQLLVSGDTRKYAEFALKKIEELKKPENENIQPVNTENKQGDIPPEEKSNPVEEVKDVPEEGAKLSIEEPPQEPPPPTEPMQETLNEGLSGITHEATESTRKEFGLGEPYEKTTKKDEELRTDAESQIKSGYNIEKLVTDIEGGKQPSDVENTILKIYKSGLEAKIEKDPSEQNINELRRFVKATDKIGSETGRSLRSRQGLEPRNDSLAGFFIRELESNNDAPLTENQKATVEKEYKDISETEKAYNDKINQLQEENAKLKAESEVRKSKGEKKPKKDYASERKQIIDDIRDKLKKSRGEASSTVIPYAKELIAIAPDVAKLVKNLAEEGVVKLGEVIDNVHEILKEHLPAITKKDVNDILAGEYNEKKPKRSELAKTLFELKQQAQLVNKLEKLLSGEEPKNENKKIQRNQEIEKLREQIKSVKNFDIELKRQEDEVLRNKKNETENLSTELGRAEKEIEAVEKNKKKASELESKKIEKEIKFRTPEEKALEAFKKNANKQVAEIENQIKTGDFSKEEKKPELKLDQEAKNLKTKLVKLKTEREVRIMKQKYENRSNVEKTKDWVLDKANVPRTIMSSMDYSAPLRQGLVAVISHPTTALKAAAEMFRASFSQKNFDEWMYDMRESPRYDVMQKSGLSVTDPHSPFLAAKEEAFMNNTAEKIPLIGKLIKGSERAYVMFLNKMRVDLFNRAVDMFEENGRTYENSPELYNAMAKLINAETGRGDLGKAIESAAPILNTVFFSPRLIASRINLLTNWANPYWYKNTPKEVRVMYMKDMLKFIGLGVSILALAKLNNQDVEDDPRSSDFGKIKSGNTRWDIWGGFQQYVRLITQLASGEKKSSNTGEVQELDRKGRFGDGRGDVINRFVRGKLAPVPSMAVDLFKGRTLDGDKVTLGNEAETHLLPLIYSDVKYAMMDKGISAMFTVGIPAIFGVGVQTFKPSSKIIPDTIEHNGKKVELNKKQYNEFETLAKDKIKSLTDKLKTLPSYQRITDPDQKKKMEALAESEAVKLSENEIKKKYPELFPRETNAERFNRKKVEHDKEIIKKQLSH